jgi:hypothetical protein
MAGVSRERIEFAKRRLQNILRSHIVATARTLENKISDAGPTNQRIDPHILTIARNELETAGVIAIYREREKSPPWYYLRETADETLYPRLAELEEIYKQTLDRHLTLRTGQALEIAISRALQSQNNFESVGHFRDLDAHDDGTLYSKEEPPSIINERTCDGKLDFVLFTRDAGTVGIEAKNIREWFYSDRDEVLEMLAKCCALDAVPVLVVRRYAYEAFSVLTECGVIVHQMYNQRYAQADAALAEKVRGKRTLGYHDVRVGNEPDERLIKFIHVNLPIVLEGARAKFDEKKELVDEYARGGMKYPEFVARVRGREFEPPEGYYAPDEGGF